MFFHSQSCQYVIYIPSFSHDVDLRHDMKYTFRGRQLELCRPLYSSSTFSYRFKPKNLGDLANVKVMVYQICFRLNSMPILSSQERSHFHHCPRSCNWCTTRGDPLYTVTPLTYRISQVKSFHSYNLQCPYWRCSYSTKIERHYRQTCMCFSSDQPTYYNPTFADYIHSQYRVTYQVSWSIHYLSDNQAQWIRLNLHIVFVPWLLWFLYVFSLHFLIRAFWWRSFPSFSCLKIPFFMPHSSTALVAVSTTSVYLGHDQWSLTNFASVY